VKRERRLTKRERKAIAGPRLSTTVPVSAKKANGVLGTARRETYDFLPCAGCEGKTRRVRVPTKELFDTTSPEKLVMLFESLNDLFLCASKIGLEQNMVSELIRLARKLRPKDMSKLESP